MRGESEPPCGGWRDGTLGFVSIATLSRWSKVDVLFEDGLEGVGRHGDSASPNIDALLKL